MVKPQTMPDTLPQVGYHRSVPSMIIYNPLTTRMTTTHNQLPRYLSPASINMWKRRGGTWILCPALQWRGLKRRLGGWACRNVRQIVSKSAQVLYGGKRVDLRAGIAQRVGTGLRPGKLRKKALSEDNKDGELARGLAKCGGYVERFSLVTRTRDRNRGFASC